MTKWTTRGLRGSVFEDIINRTNEEYRKSELALIQKIPTPITPVRIDEESRHITLAYFEKQSTVDYIGVVQGIAVCFDAKECESDTFPLANIHEHQYEFMKSFEKQDGVAFILIYFVPRSEMYYLRFSELEKFWERRAMGGRKSFRYDELSEDYRYSYDNKAVFPYLDFLSRDINEREEKS